MGSHRRGPTLALEKQLWAQGHDVVVGLDEVGRGAWAGPLTIGAAVLPTGPPCLRRAGLEAAERTAA